MTADKRVKLEGKSISFLLENDSRQKGQIRGKNYLLFVGKWQQTRVSNWRKKVSPSRQKCQIGGKKYLLFVGKWRQTKVSNWKKKSISFLLENDSQIGGKKYLLCVGELQQTVHEMAMCLLVWQELVGTVSVPWWLVSGLCLRHKHIRDITNI